MNGSYRRKEAVMNLLSSSSSDDYVRFAFAFGSLSAE
jgi:hypothetical protein